MRAVWRHNRGLTEKERVIKMVTIEKELDMSKLSSALLSLSAAYTLSP